ncbi:MAG: YybH family protein, partial [Ktedonobacterales bacterium]
TNANNAHADDRAVATVLDGVIVRGDHNMLADTAAPGIEGARAALETFYYAFNTRSVDLYQRIWADDPLVQLGSPVGGIVRGSARIAALSERMLSGSSVRVQTVLEDIVAYETPELVVFTERERGTYTRDSEHDAMSELSGSSICIFRFIAEQGGWRLVYHHVSLDDSDQLARYQRAVRGAQGA